MSAVSEKQFANWFCECPEGPTQVAKFKRISYCLENVLRTTSHLLQGKIHVITVIMIRLMYIHVNWVESLSTCWLSIVRAARAWACCATVTNWLEYVQYLATCSLFEAGSQLSIVDNHDWSKKKLNLPLARPTQSGQGPHVHGQLKFQASTRGGGRSIPVPISSRVALAKRFQTVW